MWRGERQGAAKVVGLSPQQWLRPDALSPACAGSPVGGRVWAFQAAAVLRLSSLYPASPGVTVSLPGTLSSPWLGPRSLEEFPHRFATSVGESPQPISRACGTECGRPSAQWAWDPRAGVKSHGVGPPSPPSVLGGQAQTPRKLASTKSPFMCSFMHAFSEKVPAVPAGGQQGPSRTWGHSSEYSRPQSLSSQSPTPMGETLC